jgi:hypothetical protein
MRLAFGTIASYVDHPMLWRSSSSSSSAPARRPEGFIEPCLPTVGQFVPSGPQWVHEIKHDGFGFICRREGNRIRILSRRGHDWTDRVPRIVDKEKSMAPEFLLGPPTPAQLARSGGHSFLDFEDAIDVVRAAGKLGPQHPAAQQGKTVGRAELSH